MVDAVDSPIFTLIRQAKYAKVMDGIINFNFC